MAQIAIGKQLPNLKITLGNDYKSSDVLEEGEASDSESSLKITEPIDENDGKSVEINRKFSSPLETFRKYENKGGGFITGLDLSLESISKKLEERAARFGFEEHKQKPITQADISALYQSLDIDSSENSSPSSKSKNIRLDALHMRGVDEMSTNDVFEYFKEYGPASVEWINDYSCNVVWLDEVGAARALLGLSRVLIIQKKSQMKEDGAIKEAESEGKKTDDKTPEIEEVIIMSDTDSDDDDEDDDDKLVSFKHQKSKENDEELQKMEVDEDNTAKAEDSKNSEEINAKENVDVPVPPGHWRLGVPHAKAKAVLLRFASKDDRKVRGAEKRSHYYKKYGNPNYGGMRGIITATRKRKINATRTKINLQHLAKKDDETNSKIDDFPIYMTNPGRVKRVRMRMYADDEEIKILRNAKRQPRSIANKSKNSIHNRLGKSHHRYDDRKTRRVMTSEDEEDFENNNDRSLRSFVLKPGTTSSKTHSRYNIWTSLAKDMAEESEEILPKRKRFNPSPKDLRNKLHTSLLHRESHRAKRNHGNDLRSKLNTIRRTSDVSEHRSPLVVEIDNSDYD